MYEVQLEKVMKAEAEKNKAMHEIAEFITKQIEELANMGIYLYDDECEENYVTSVEFEEDEQKLFIKFDY
jgi:putative methionine-R-sulfoxide reductase with GAF domain